MSLPESRQAYPDCYRILDAALEDKEGVRVEVGSYEQAIHFRMRIHQARKINRRDNEITYEPGDPMYAASIYDKLIIRIRRDDERWWVYIQHLGLELGEVERLSGLDDDTEAVTNTPLREPVEVVLGKTEPVRRRV